MADDSECGTRIGRDRPSQAGKRASQGIIGLLRGAQMTDYFDTIRGILALKPIKASAKLVLIYLYDKQGGNGHSWPSIGKIQHACGLTRPTVAKALCDLRKAGLIQVSHPKKPSVRESNRYSVNLELVKESNQSTGKETEPVKNLNQLRTLTRTGKDSLPELVKNLNPNDSYNDPSNDPHTDSSSRDDSVRAALQLAVLLRDLILARQPKAREKRAKMADWARDIERLIHIDGHSPEEIEAVIQWCQADPFWQANIRSGKKLREKYDTLEAQMKRPARAADRRQCYDRDYTKQTSAYGTTIRVG